jgi:PAS domain-containing protein
MRRGNSLLPATVFAINEPFYCKVKTAWPEVGIIGDSEYEIQPGPTLPENIIALRYHGRPYLYRLIDRDSRGNLLVCGRDGRTVGLNHDSFTLEGRLVLDSRRSLSLPPVSEQPSLIITDSLLSWRNDAQGSNVSISLKWIKTTGESPDEIKALGWLSSAHPDDRERIVRARDAGIKSGELYFIDYQLRGLSGKYIPIHSYSAPLFGDNGEILGWHGAAQIKSGG